MAALRTVVVPIGELRVSCDPEEVLTTCTGSCVAVALWDCEATVAGLLHVVLPGSGRPGPAEYPETYYAGSGVALLVEEMLRQGAHRENLAASLAGGASLLPDEVSRDSVGSRNVRQVVSALGERGVPIRNRDVGGREARRVALRVRAGEVEVSPTCAARSRSPEPLVPGPPEGFAELLARLAALGPNPAVAGALLDAVHEAPVDWFGVGEIASGDLVLMLHLLRLANSSAYGVPGGVGSLEAALDRLGPAQLRRICVVAATARNAERSLADVAGLEPLMRHHCRASALIARRLTGHLSAEAQGEAFAATLLHGVGVIASRLCSGGAVAGWEPSELGALVLSAWNLPEAAIAACRGHGSPQEWVAEAPSPSSVSGAACALAHLLGVPCPCDPVGPPASLLAGLGTAGGGIVEFLRDLQVAHLLDEP